MIYKAEQLAAAQPGGMLDPRLFVCLDEAGNCAAIKKLPQLATTGRGQGIQLLTIWHDEAQLQHRYGHRASTVLNGHRAKLLLSGQADPASLELASKLVGDEAVTQTSETTGGDGRASLTESTAYRRLLPPEALRQLKPRRALLVYGHLPPVRIRLRPWFRSRRLVTAGHGRGRRRAAPGHGRRRPRPGRGAAADRRGGGRRLMTAPPTSRPCGQRHQAASARTGGQTPLASGPPRPAPGGVSRLDRVTLQLGVAVAVVIAAVLLCGVGDLACTPWGSRPATAGGRPPPSRWWPTGRPSTACSASSAAPAAAPKAPATAGCWSAAAPWPRSAATSPTPNPTWSPRPSPPPSPWPCWPCWKASRATPARSPAWPPRPPTWTARARSPSPASSRRPPPSDAPTPTANPDTAAAALGSQRRALPAGPEPTDNTTVGARLQAAYAQPRPDGQPWTARTLAEAAGCGRSSAASFLQRQRPPAAERTP